MITVARAIFLWKWQISFARFFRKMPAWITNNIKMLYSDRIENSEGLDI